MKFEKQESPGGMVFEAGDTKILGIPRLLHVELPTLIVCLAPLVAKSMSVGAACGIAETKQPSTTL